MRKDARIADVSIPLHTRMITYPGNPRVKLVSKKGKTSYHTEITIGSHTGTHVDAPRHVFRKGKGVEGLRLQSFIGRARVLDCTASKEAVSLFDLEKKRIKRGERILLKTKNSRRGFKTFYKDYVCLAPDAAAFLAKKKVALLGIDALSVKKAGSTDNRPHTELLRKGIPIVEGLNLKGVSEGVYILFLLPLKLVKLDGAPARACLIPISEARRLVYR